MFAVLSKAYNRLIHKYISREFSCGDTDDNDDETEASGKMAESPILYRTLFS
jgi:hypothetical protein